MKRIFQFTPFCSKRERVFSFGTLVACYPVTIRAHKAEIDSIHKALLTFFPLPLLPIILLGCLPANYKVNDVFSMCVSK